MRQFRRALRVAFPYTIPIFAGFWFLGLTYGVLMNVSGFRFVYPMLMSATIFGGSLEFVVVTMLLSSFAPLQALIMAFIIQARHLFFGLTMLDKYRNTGWKKFFLIFMMCDETFSINCSVEVPEGVDRSWFYLSVSVLDYFYWVSGATIGGLLGNLIHFNTSGLEFVMTAMFVVIFLDHWKKEHCHISTLIGGIAAVVCLLLFGTDSFMIPTMICVLVLLLVFRKPLEKKGGDLT